METASTPIRKITSSILNISFNADHAESHTHNSKPPFETIQQIHKNRQLENELQSLKEAFNKLESEKLLLEAESKREQEMYMLTINQLKTVITSLDKEKETLEEQLVSEYEVSENSIMETEIKLHELQELYEDSQENWEREKETLQNSLVQQKEEISELKKGKIELESFSSRCQEKVHKLKGQVHDLKEEIKHLKALVSINKERPEYTKPFYKDRTLISTDKTGSVFDCTGSPASDKSTVALESPGISSPVKSNSLNPLSSQFIDLLKKELSSSERQARRNRINPSYKSSFKLPGNLMSLITKPKK